MKKNIILTVVVALSISSALGVANAGTQEAQKTGPNGNSVTVTAGAAPGVVEVDKEVHGSNGGAIDTTKDYDNGDISRTTNVYGAQGKQYHGGTTITPTTTEHY